MELLQKNIKNQKKDREDLGETKEKEGRREAAGQRLAKV